MTKIVLDQQSMILFFMTVPAGSLVSFSDDNLHLIYTMSKIRRLILDVLKPHQPNIVDFATCLADLGADYRIRVTVAAVDKMTESILLEIEGGDLQFENIYEEIKKMGASVHSLDEVDVDGMGVSVHSLDEVDVDEMSPPPQT